MIDARTDGTVLLEIRTLKGEPDIIGRFDKLTKILERVTNAQGELKVNTGQAHLGMT